MNIARTSRVERPRTAVAPLSAIANSISCSGLLCRVLLTKISRCCLNAALLIGLSCTAARAHDLAAVRQEFNAAYEAAIKGAEPNDSAALRGYLLYPYLRQARLQRALSEGVDIDDAVAEFLQTHGTQPVTRELRRAWYASLAARKQWRTYLDHYREVDDATLRCHALTARLNERRDDKLLDSIVAQWSSAADSLPACESAFTHLKQSGALTPALIERRARVALRAGNPAFARQIIAMLPSESQPPLLAWARLIEKPLQAIDAAIAQPQSAIEPDALLDGWTRLARADASTAMLRLAPLTRARKLDAATQSRFALELALALSWSRRPESLRYFANVRAVDFDERGYEWHARAAIWQSNWALTRRVIDSMPESLRKQTRWRYWQARATELLGEMTVARTQYRTLLSDDNFHAALAAARLEVGYLPNPQTLPIDRAQLGRLAAQPEFQRAHELRLTSRRELRAMAYEEWRSLYASLSVEERRHAVALAAEWGWYDQAIALAAQQGLFNDYDLFYPRPFDSEVDDAVARTEVPGSLIYATLRQESLYRSDALSLADARGVMQLLPETATRVARRWRLPVNVANGELFDPKINIPIGAAKLRDQLNRFGHVAPALAAYNAGPNTVPRWLPAKPMEADAWIENIPYNETRTYVQRIHWHSLVYAWQDSGAAQDVRVWLTPVKRH